MEQSSGPTGRSAAPARFQAALQSLQHTHIRPEVHLTEAPAPQRVAPYAVAIDGEVYPSPGANNSSFTETDDLAPTAEGTLVVLYDPQSQENWEGQFRLVSYLEAEVDRVEASDPMLPSAAWSWVTDAIGHYPVHNLSGTVSLVASTSFEGKTETGGKSILQIRASWSPANEMVGPHLAMWTDMLAAAGGLERLPSEVTSLEEHRQAHLNSHPSPDFAVHSEVVGQLGDQSSAENLTGDDEAANHTQRPGSRLPLANISPRHPSLHHSQHPLNTTV